MGYSIVSTSTKNSENPFSQQKRLAVILFALPLAVYFWAFSYYAVNMPYWDDYDSVLGFMNKVESSRFWHRMLLLFSQHNEHRIVFDHVIFIFDYVIEGKINFIVLDFIGALGLAAITLLLVRMMTREKFQTLWWFPISFAMFSLVQWELVSFAMATIQQYWQLFFCLASLYFIADGTRKSYAASCALAVIACFTGAGGFVAFPAGAIGFLVLRRWRALAGWLATGAVTAAVYFVILPFHQTALETASHHYALHHPLMFALYVVAFLGNAVTMPIAALALGLVLAVMFCLRAVPVLVRIARTGLATETDVSAFRVVLFGLFVLGTAGAAGTGRISMGVLEALSSRYTAYGLLLFCLVYMLMLFETDGIKSRRATLAVLGTGAAILFLNGLLVGLVNLPIRQGEMLDFIAYPHQAEAQRILTTSMRNGLFRPDGAVIANLPDSAMSELEPKTPGEYSTAAALPAPSAHFVPTGCAGAWQRISTLYHDSPRLPYFYPLTGAASYRGLLDRITDAGLFKTAADKACLRKMTARLQPDAVRSAPKPAPTDPDPGRPGK